MKDQYFGDIYDYFKYSLLRLLTRQGQLRTAVCWMLTPNDRRADGHRTQYLRESMEWSAFDPVVYRFLREHVIERNTRKIKALETSTILPSCRFYSEILGDEYSQRQEYLKEFLDFAWDANLVFFDPDTGMEVKSVPIGRKHSSKYLYWSEVSSSFSAGHSLFVYQHLPPKPRDPFIDELADRFIATTGARCVYSYHNRRVAFFLSYEVLLIDGLTFTYKNSTEKFISDCVGAGSRP